MVYHSKWVIWSLGFVRVSKMLPEWEFKIKLDANDNALYVYYNNKLKQRVCNWIHFAVNYKWQLK